MTTFICIHITMCIFNDYLLKIARPDRPSIAYIGDGAWGMSLNEILTCVRENIPAIGVVFNNGQWGAEKKNQVSVKMK